MADNFVPLRGFYTGSAVTAVGEYQSGETMVLPGSLNFSGNGRRITGDMGSGAGSFANRVFFQSSVTNQNTFVNTVPNGTSTTSGFQAWANSGDLENSTRFDVYVTAGESRIESGRTGTGAYVPLTLHASGAVRIRVNTDGSVEFPTAGTRIRGDFGSGPGSLTNRTIFQNATANSQTAITVMPSGTGNVAALQLFSSSDPENSSRGNINLISNTNMDISTSQTGTGSHIPITLSTSNIERMRIQAGGVIRLNGANDNPISSNSSGVSINTAGYTQIRAPTTVVDFGTTGANTILGFYSGTSAVGSISTNGTVTAYNTSSDYRLKDNIQPLNKEEALDRIKRYEPVTWTWLSNGSVGKGFIAHKNQEIDSETATGTKDAVRRLGNIALPDSTIISEEVEEPKDWSVYPEGSEWIFTKEVPVYQGRDDTKIIPDLVATVQYLISKIEGLETELAALKGA